MAFCRYDEVSEEDFQLLQEQLEEAEEIIKSVERLPFGDFDGVRTLKDRARRHRLRWLSGTKL